MPKAIIITDIQLNKTTTISWLLPVIIPPITVRCNITADKKKKNIAAVSTKLFI